MSYRQSENNNASHRGDEMEVPQVFTKTNMCVAQIVAKAVLDRPWLIKVVRLLKKERTRVAIIMTVWCLAEGVYYRERPFTLAQPNVWAVSGLLLIVCGLAFRLAALGCIRKKEQLATHGVYSLCRHPLYLGSVLLALGFCILLADFENFLLAAAYFVVFYPLTILWEEDRLALRYGEAHHRYRARTPMLLPVGDFLTGEFTWRAAMSRGGVLLLSAVVILLASVEVMAEVLKP